MHDCIGVVRARKATSINVHLVVRKKLSVWHNKHMKANIVIIFIEKLVGSPKLKFRGSSSG